MKILAVKRLEEISPYGCLSVFTLFHHDIFSTSDEMLVCTNFSLHRFLDLDDILLSKSFEITSNWTYLETEKNQGFV